ncbi:MAG TPA: PAS domain S-box protein [Sphingobacteriaceae bacterium]
MLVSDQKLHILIVEDNPGDSLLIEDYLNEEFVNPKLSRALTFSQAKDYLTRNLLFNVILLDLSLPDASGEFLVTEIVRLAASTPVIVLTGYSDKDFGVKTLSYGVSDYLLKDELLSSQLHKSIIYSIERKRINIKLNESEEKYRRLFNFSPLPQWVFDVDSLQFLDVNEAAIKHYGYSREEFLQMTIKDIRPLEDIGILQATLDSSKKTGSFNPTVVRHLKKNGELIYVNVEGNSIFFEGRNARMVLVVDITEKIKAEQALMKSEQRFKALVQEGTDLISILDRDGNYIYVSPTTESILGIRPELFIGKNAFDFIFEDDKDRIISQFALLAEQKRIEIPPFRFKVDDNDYRWIETVITDMTDDPSVAGIVANSKDVTLRIENENKLKENIERFNTVSKATSDTIYDWDFSTNKILWNQGMLEIFGHNLTDHTTFDWWYNQVHPDDAERIASNVQLHIQNKKSIWKGEYRFRCMDGTYKFVMDRSFLVYNDTGQPVRMIGSIQDITERVNYIQAIEEQNMRLKEISWIQSHIVRAPLARIMGLVDILKNYPNDDNCRVELLGHILTSADELDDVIKSIVNHTEQVENQQNQYQNQ